MTITLTTMTARVRALLVDSGAQLWSDAALTEGIRMALGEYRLAGNADVTLEGLDGAAATSFDPLHDGLFVLGGAAYAAVSRAVSPAERIENPGGAAIKAWGDQRLKEFKAMLCALFPGYLAAVTLGDISGADPARQAAEIALLTAQANHTQALAAAASGQESRAAAAAAQASQDRGDEVTRLAGLRAAIVTPWGVWTESE